jgi:hypothetical protein
VIYVNASLMRMHSTLHDLDRIHTYSSLLLAALIGLTDICLNPLYLLRTIHFSSSAAWTCEILLIWQISRSAPPLNHVGYKIILVEVDEDKVCTRNGWQRDPEHANGWLCPPLSFQSFMLCTPFKPDSPRSFDIQSPVLLFVGRPVQPYKPDALYS